MRILVDSGAKLLLPDAGGEMCRVAFAGDVHLMEILILAGAQPGVYVCACTNMWVCVCRRRKVTIKLLFDQTTPDAGDYDKRTALHIAACEGNWPMCSVLIRTSEGKKCLDACDRWKQTPVDEAEREGHVQVAKDLKQWSDDLAEAANLAGTSRSRSVPRHNSGGMATVVSTAMMANAAAKRRRSLKKPIIKPSVSRSSSRNNPVTKRVSAVSYRSDPSTESFSTAVRTNPNSASSSTDTLRTRATKRASYRVP